MQYTKSERFALPASLVLLTGLILLTGLMLRDPKPGDPIQAINRYEVKRHKSWEIKERRPMLQIPDGLREDKEWLTLYLSGDSGLSRGAIEQYELVLKLFDLVENKAWKDPGDYEYFTEIMKLLTKKIALVKKFENYQGLTSILVNIMMILLMVVIVKEGINCLLSWYSKEGRLILLIFASLSQDEKEWFTLRFIRSDSHIPVPAGLQLFIVLLEKFAFIGPRDLEYIIKIMQFWENTAIIVKDKEKYKDSQQSSTLTIERHMIELAQTAAVIPHPSTDADHMPDLPKYKMDRLPRGMCIIFNAENFTKEDLEKRDGTQKDVEALLNTFQNRLKFKTCVVHDPTKKEYVEYLQNIGRMDHSKYDCFVCIILSHGFKGHVCGTDGGTVSIDALTGLFRGDYVPSLVNKPKLFFIQACQGAYPQAAVDIQQDDTASLPFKSDTLVSLYTVPGYASFRNVNQGSLFIISLCDIINTYYKKKVDLLSMLTMVNELMSREAIEGKWMEIGKQIGIHSNILRKQIFFNEGLDE